jgi:hypothetical protein
VGVHSYAPRLTTRPGERPLASALARWQARRGGIVTTITGATVNLEGALAREMVGLLDGTRDRGAIVAELGRLYEAGRIGLPAEGGKPVPPRRARQIFRDGIGDRLVQLARLGLLVE